MLSGTVVLEPTENSKEFNNRTSATLSCIIANRIPMLPKKGKSINIKVINFNGSNKVKSTSCVVHRQMVKISLDHVYFSLHFEIDSDRIALGLGSIQDWSEWHILE